VSRRRGAGAPGPERRAARAAAAVAVTAAVVIGYDSLTHAATGGSLLLGRANTAGAITTVERTTSGPVLALTAANPAVAPPFTTNATGKVDNLFAAKAANALRLGGSTISQIGAAAPAGAAGPRGTTGPDGLIGVSTVLRFAASNGSLPAPAIPLPAPTMLASRSVTITSFTQRMTGSAHLVMSTPGFTKNKVLFGLCTQLVTTTPVVSVGPAVFWRAPDLSAANALEVDVSGEEEQTFTGSAFGLAPGLYNVGACAIDVSGSASTVNVAQARGLVYVSDS